jgi:ankyrin repeat protein
VLVDTDSKDKKGRMPLQVATGNGHEAVVKLLLKNGAEVEIDDKGWIDCLIISYT